MIVCDSGATKSLISISYIEHSDYLSKIEKIQVIKLDFQVASGETIRPKYAIKFKVKIQNHTIEITAFVIDSLGTIDLILGTKSLSELDSSLDFSNNTLHFKSQSILLKANKQITLLPGETKTIELIGQLPSFLRNSDVHIKCNSFLSQFTPKDLLVHLRKGRATILAHKTRSKVAKIHIDKPVAKLELDNNQFYTRVHKIHMGKEKLILFCNESDAGQIYICGESIKKHLKSASQHTEAEGLYQVQEVDREAIFKEKG